MQHYDYDVIIVGGGMVGMTLAAALADSGLSIALIEHQAPTAAWSAMELPQRVSAISYASQQIFTQLQVWDTIRDLRVSPYKHMYVWDTEGHIEFDCQSVQQDALGYIIENRVIEQALRQRLTAWPQQIHWICPAQLQQLQSHDAGINTGIDTGIELKLSTGQQLTCRLLVGADGSHSQVRQQAGIELHSWSYQQTAIVATISTEQPHQATAWQHFLPSGPLAFLPLATAHQSSIVWSVPPALAAELIELTDEDFCKRLSLAFDLRLGKVTHASPRMSFPLTMRHAKHYVKPQLALIGDAAHTMHPLAGQGLNMGLLDAACLAEVILNAHAKQQDWASYKHLRRYERWRKGHNLSLLATVEAFKRIFSNEQPVLRTLRNLGLQLTHRVPMAKRLLIEQAMGLSGDLPRLAKASL